MGREREAQTGGNWLERKLSTLDALYDRFGREGLKDHSLVDVRLLLSSKELRLRDAAKSRDLGEDQKAANRQLELEVKDLTTYVKGQLVGLSLSDLRSFGQRDQQRQNEPQKKRVLTWRGNQHSTGTTAACVRKHSYSRRDYTWHRKEPSC